MKVYVENLSNVAAWFYFISKHIQYCDHGYCHIHVSRSQNEKLSINAILVSAYLSINSKKERRIQRKREEMEKNVGKCARLESKNTKKYSKSVQTGHVSRSFLLFL